MWLSDYLTDRIQKTCFGDTSSKTAGVGTGVPQGSVLGPLLFVYFINTVAECVGDKVNVIMYADDIVILAEGDTFVEADQQLNGDMAVANQWCENNCLTINKKKTKVMRFVRNRQRGEVPRLTVRVGNAELEEVDSYRYLGVTVDKRMTFKPQTLSVIKSVSHKNSLLGRIRRYMGEKQSLLIYKQKIVPYADYASFLIDCTTQDLVNKLQRLQNKALRIRKYKNMYQQCSATELHTEYGLSTLIDRRFRQLQCFMFKKSKEIGYSIEENLRRTRNDRKVKFAFRINHYMSSDKSPWTRGVQMWNELEPETQRAPKMEAFKTMIKDLKAG